MGNIDKQQIVKTKCQTKTIGIGSAQSTKFSASESVQKKAKFIVVHRKTNNNNQHNHHHAQQESAHYHHHNHQKQTQAKNQNEAVSATNYSDKTQTVQTTNTLAAKTNH